MPDEFARAFFPSSALVYRRQIDLYICLSGPQISSFLIFPPLHFARIRHFSTFVRKIDANINLDLHAAAAWAVRLVRVLNA